MIQYQNQLTEVMTYGKVREDRTGVGTISLFSPSDAHYDLSKGFPLVTTKKLFTRGIFEELLWFLSGSTNNRDLNEVDVHIWDEWQREDGELGPIYGHQWRDWGGGYRYYPVIEGVDPETKDKKIGFNRVKMKGIDQISKLIENIKNDPYSRRHIVSAWNVSDLYRMALAPCHCFFQVYVQDDTLSLKLYQRSADMFLGVPFNIASYALLTHMLAAQTGYKPGKFIHSIGDAHVYKNHITQISTILSRVPKDLPTLTLDPSVKSIFHYTMDHIKIEGYHPYPAIKGDVAV